MSFKHCVILSAAWLVVLTPGERACCDEAGVEVTGRTMSVNGRRTLPEGLFGVHAMKRLTPEVIDDWGIEMLRVIHFQPAGGPTIPARKPNLGGLKMVIDCFGDRYHPATVLTDPNYKQHFAELGRSFALACKRADWPGWAEFWNEPYLNWADRSRVNYRTRYYDVTQAREGGKVTIKGWDKPLQHLRWRRVLRAVDGSGKVRRKVQVPDGLQAGQSFTVPPVDPDRPADPNADTATYTVSAEWEVYDPTQVSWWSGRQNRDFYIWMFTPFARAAKQANPRVTIIGGWGFHIYMGGWSAWRELYRPVIDAGMPYIDGVCEHHYGSDTRLTAASYELVTAYGVARHGKWLTCYNTETGGKLDPAMPGQENVKAPDAYAGMTYHLRDILYLLRHCPAKAAGRAAHEPRHWSGGGDKYAFQLLRPLRGRLVESASSDRDIWTVAAVNGAELVVALFNDARGRRKGTLRIAPPTGTAILSARVSRVLPAPDGKLRLATEAVPSASSRLEAAYDLPSRHAAVYRLKLDQAPPAGPERVRRQFFTRKHLVNVRRGKSFRTRIDVDPLHLRRASAATIKLVVQGVSPGEAEVSIGENAFPIPAGDPIVEIPVGVELISPRTQLRLSANRAGDGFLLVTPSLVLDAPAP